MKEATGHGHVSQLIQIRLKNNDSLSIQLTSTTSTSSTSSHSTACYPTFQTTRFQTTSFKLEACGLESSLAARQTLEACGLEYFLEACGLECLFALEACGLELHFEDPGLHQPPAQKSPKNHRMLTECGYAWETHVTAGKASL